MSNSLNPPQTLTATALNPTFFSIQALRAFAAVLVVLCHSSQLWSEHIRKANQNFFWRNGETGVDIFFVISGFVMTIVTGRGPRRPLTFLFRRIQRIVPMYWICTLLAIAAILFDHGHEPDFAGHLHRWHVLASFLFIPSKDYYGSVFPLLTDGWTLSYEMFFYLIFSFALATKKDVAMILTVIMVPISVAGLFFQPSSPAVTVLLQPIILEFLAGVYLARFLKDRQNLPVLPLVIAAVVGLAVLFFVPEPFNRARPLLWGIAAFALVASIVLLERRIGRRIPRWILLIGDASYSLYLSHLFVLFICVSVLRRIHFLSSSEFVFCAVTLVVSTFIALLIFRYVEAPLTLTLARRTHQRPPAIIVQGEKIATAS